jgi:hypothetical protein
MWSNLADRIWPSYVDPHLPVTKEDRKAIHREAWRLWAGNKWNIALYLCLPLAYVLGIPLVRDVAGMAAALLGAGGLAIRLSRAAALVLLTVACFVIGGVVLQRYRFAPLVYRATHRRGFDVCLKCGYWLRALPQGERCPECGAERGPRRDDAGGGRVSS